MRFRHLTDNPLRLFEGSDSRFGVDIREHGDPPPFYRAAARWEGDLLVADSVIAPSLPIARWENGRSEPPRRLVPPCGERGRAAPD
ncbi:MAG TPA: hypothetical protein VIL20_09590, partial [Sandaracinaceae bacterium]